MFDHLRRDYRRLADYRQRSGLRFFLETALFDNGFQAVALHRAAHRCKRLGLVGVAPALARANLFLTGVDISPSAVIGPGLVISHGVGLVIGGSVEVGTDALLHHQVTIGAPTVGRIAQMPKLGNSIVVGTGATLIGPIEVGDRSFIGAGALVTRDIPANAKVTQRAEPEIEISEASSGGTPTG